MKFNKFLDALCVVCMALILLLVVVQVVMRYVFNSPLTWSEELAVYIMVWMTFAGSVICMRDKEHVEVTILVDYLPRRLQKLALLFSRLASIVFLVVVIYYGSDFVMENRTVVSVANNLNMALVYSIIPLSCLGMLYYVVRTMMKGE